MSALLSQWEHLVVFLAYTNASPKSLLKDLFLDKDFGFFLFLIMTLN